jgi:hypothetical protein
MFLTSIPPKVEAVLKNSIEHMNESQGLDNPPYYNSERLKLWFANNGLRSLAEAVR